MHRDTQEGTTRRALTPSSGDFVLSVAHESLSRSRKASKSTSSSFARRRERFAPPENPPACLCFIARGGIQPPVPLPLVTPTPGASGAKPVTTATDSQHNIIAHFIIDALLQRTFALHEIDLPGNSKKKNQFFLGQNLRTTLRTRPPRARKAASQRKSTLARGRATNDLSQSRSRRVVAVDSADAQQQRFPAQRWSTWS